MSEPGGRLNRVMMYLHLNARSKSHASNWYIMHLFQFKKLDIVACAADEYITPLRGLYSARGTQWFTKAGSRQVVFFSRRNVPGRRSLAQDTTLTSAIPTSAKIRNAVSRHHNPHSRVQLARDPTCQQHQQPSEPHPIPRQINSKHAPARLDLCRATIHGSAHPRSRQMPSLATKPIRMRPRYKMMG